MLSAKLIGPLALLVTIGPVSAPMSGQSGGAETRDVVGSARRAYYSLNGHSFNGFHAAIEPDWKVILGPTATPENLKVFRALHFSVIVDASGAAIVNHEFPTTQQNKLAPYLKQIHYDIQRLVSSFFGTWALFMISSPFPESQIKIDSAGNEYRLLYNVQSAEVVLAMSREFVIREMRVTDPKSKRTINPVFRKTAEGFVLSGYHTVFEPVGEGSRSTTDITVAYRDVGGLKLPNKIHITGVYDGEPIEAALRFNQHVLRRN